MCERNENQQKAKGKGLCVRVKGGGGRISCNRRILFSFQKNHLKMTFYTAWICLFMCPQHGHRMRGNIDCWVSGGRSVGPGLGEGGVDPLQNEEKWKGD